MKEDEKLENKKKVHKDIIPEDVTREINLDELYDGAVNNTVIIDPVTNDEMLFSNKKTNFKIIGVLFAVLLLLVFYYINNKTKLGATTKDVAPIATTTTTSVKEELTKKSGTLKCNYSSHSDTDVQTITYTADFKDDLILNSDFNYVVISSNNETTAIIEDLKSQYETFYLNNASLSGSSANFEKTDNGFTFTVNTNYETAEFDKIVLVEGQTILYVKPELNDTYEMVLNAYTNKGFVCNLLDNKKEENNN